MQTFRERLGALRAVADLSQRELSMLAGATPSVVSQLEAGLIVSPSGRLLLALARVLGCTAEWLMEGVGAEPADEAVRASVEAARARQAEAEKPTGT